MVVKLGRIGGVKSSLAWLSASILFCFKTATAFGGTVFTHAPYEQNACDMCHKIDSTGKAIPKQFVASQPDLCYQCHESKTDLKYTHAALDMGDCTSSCHLPHQSPNRFLLREKIGVLCVQCHDAPGLDQPVKHNATSMLMGCARCHSPHSSNRPKLLQDDTSKLCVYCHKDIGKNLLDKTNHVHAAVQMGCQNCHEPHGGQNDKLMKETLNDLCFKCHEPKRYNSHPQAGHPTSGMNDPIFPEKPFTCISCHKPHYSKNERLLRYRFKKGETPYDGTICSVCHWQEATPPPHPNWND